LGRAYFLLISGPKLKGVSGATASFFPRMVNDACPFPQAFAKWHSLLSRISGGPTDFRRVSFVRIETIGGFERLLIVYDLTISASQCIT
jgi:hypothetical protein